MGRLTKNSKNPIMPIVPSMCAIVAMTAPNHTQHAQANARASESREITQSLNEICDVAKPCPVTPVAMYRMPPKVKLFRIECVNLIGEYFKHWGERHKLLAETRKRTASATLDWFCQENAVKTRLK